MDFLNYRSSRAYRRTAPQTGGASAGSRFSEGIGLGTRKLAGARPKRGHTQVDDHIYARIIAAILGWWGRQSYLRAVETSCPAPLSPRRFGNRRLLRQAVHLISWSLPIIVLAQAPGPALAQAESAPIQNLPAQSPPSGMPPARLPALRQGWTTLVQAEALIRYLGLVVSTGGSSLTLQGPEGILTLFEDSPDFLWQPRDGGEAREASLSAASRRLEGEWWLPVDVLSYLGLWLNDGVAEGPDGLALRLVFPASPQYAGHDGELVDLGSGVPGLRMFSVGSAGPATQSLLLADAGLLGLAFPGQQQQFDDLVARSGRDRPLLLVVTAVSEGAWDTVIEFSQGALSTEARYPFRLRLLQGEAAIVGPNSPVLGVVLLPEGFSLREPIRVRWGEARATVTFRR